VNRLIGFLVLKSGVSRAAAGLFLATLVVAGCADHVPAPVRYKATPAQSGAFGSGSKIVFARHGDTVYAIARRTGTSVRAIIDHNGLRPPYHLSRGQRVKVPGPLLHVVRTGETVYSISRRYGVDMATLVRANYIRRPYMITPGQRLTVPGRTTASANAGTPKRTATKTATKKPLPPPPRRTGKRFGWPVKGKLLSGFGAKPGGLHNDGINIAVDKGTNVRAAESGVVAYSGNELRGFGYLILLRHAGGWVTAYAHNQRLLVERGDRIRRHQVIAKSGASGNVKIPQVHFEIRKGSAAVDPHKHLASALDRYPQFAAQVLDKLPGDPARARAPGDRPLDRPRPQRIAFDHQSEVIGIALDHGHELFLVAAMEAEP
jgi:murein DD-endopeptidase MepM/ murein hydrolase activator NlpD